MKLATWTFCFMLMTTAVRAQNPPAPAQAPPSPPPMQGPMHSHHHMQGPGTPMPDMKAQVEKMRATLDQMKANLGQIKDPELKKQVQFEVDLWEAMVGHMEGMAAMMSQGHGMDMGAMQGGMGCCCGMREGSGCCGGMKGGDGGKCMQKKPPETPPAARQ